MNKSWTGPCPLIAYIGLASGHTKSQVPFTDLSKSPMEFIDTEYIPEGVIFKDPRNMLKQHIVDFCDNIRRRQIQYGTQEAFRFRKYYDGRGMSNAEYGRRADHDKAATLAAKQRERRAAMSKSKGSSKKKGKNVRVAAAAAESTNSGEVLNQNQAERADDFSNIDPSLLPLPSPPSILLGHGIPSPRSTPPEPERYVMVGFSEMERLKRHGYTGIPAINGPNQGPPMYSIPATVRRLLDSPDKFSPPSGILPVPGRLPDSDNDLLPTNLGPAVAGENNAGPRRSQRSQTTRAGNGKETAMALSMGGRKAKRGR